VLEISSKRGISGEMQKIYQEMSQHLQLQKFVSNPDGQKNIFCFAATQHHHQTVRCNSAEEKTSFFKTQIILKTYFRIAYIS